MSAASCLLSEDQFLCCICLEVFTDPVSTPCGHNFCKNCITLHWNSSPLCECPICKRKYYTRPELHVNTFISEMAAQFKLSAQQQQHEEKTEAEIQEMIQKRKIKIGEMKHSVQLSKEEADRVTAEGVQIFTSLIEFAKSSMKALIKTIEEQQRTAEKQAEGRMKELKQEISELMQRSSEVEQLTRPEDILHLIQSLSSVKAAPPTKDWTNISVHLPSYT